MTDNTGRTFELDEVTELIERSRGREMTVAERLQQMLSFVYGNQADDSRRTMSEIRKNLGFPPEPSNIGRV